MAAGGSSAPKSSEGIDAALERALKLFSENQVMVAGSLLNSLAVDKV